MTDKLTRLLVWDGQQGKVVSDGVPFIFTEKPELEEVKFDTLYYEPEASNAFKTIQGNVSQLSTEEVLAICVYADNFQDVEDYTVWTYDGDTRLYTGPMLKSEAVDRSIPYVLIGSPDISSSKLSVDNSQWEQLKAVVYMDGRVVMDPPAGDKLAVWGYTEQEWLQIPPRPSDNWSLNVSTGEWEDRRPLDIVKLNVWTTLNITYFNDNDVKAKYSQTEIDSWRIKLEEAKLWKAGKRSEIPFIRALLEARTKTVPPTLIKVGVAEIEDYVNTVLDKHNAYLVRVAKIEALKESIRTEIYAMKSNDELDVYLTKMMNTLTIPLKV